MSSHGRVLTPEEAESLLAEGRALQDKLRPRIEAMSKPTSDEWLRKGGSHKIYNALGAEWLADRAAVRAFLGTVPLPECFLCCGVAMRYFTGPAGQVLVCDVCVNTGRYRFVGDMPHAQALRVLLERKRGWDGEG